MYYVKKKCTPSLLIIVILAPPLPIYFCLLYTSHEYMCIFYVLCLRNICSNVFFFFLQLTIAKPYLNVCTVTTTDKHSQFLTTTETVSHKILHCLLYTSRCV